MNPLLTQLGFSLWQVHQTKECFPLKFWSWPRSCRGFVSRYTNIWKICRIVANKGTNFTLNCLEYYITCRKISNMQEIKFRKNGIGLGPTKNSQAPDIKLHKATYSQKDQLSHERSVDNQGTSPAESVDTCLWSSLQAVDVHQRWCYSAHGTKHASLISSPMLQTRTCLFSCGVLWSIGSLTSDAACKEPLHWLASSCDASRTL